MNSVVSEFVAETSLPVAERVAERAHSPYLVARLAGQRPNLYGTVKFDTVARELRALGEKLGRPPRILDLGCSTSISRHYLEINGLEFEYCGVDYEAEFEPDIVMDVRRVHDERHKLPWQPDAILLLDVLEHLPGRDADIVAVMRQCNELIPDHGLVLVVVPQLYRLDRLKLGHLHYPEHQVRFTLGEWQSLVTRAMTVVRRRGIGYLSCLPYLPMLSPWYEEKGAHGDLFRFLRGKLFEWAPLKPIEIGLTRLLGRLPGLQGWCNSTLLVCGKR